MTKPLINCSRLSFAYDGHIAVEDLNFSVYSGDYLSIVGENGSGKSTLIKGMLGLVKPGSGSITTNGLKSNEIGYLPQQTAAQKDFPASVYEVVLSGRLNSQGIRPFYNKADKKIVFENMERLNITAVKNQCYRELSGGQQQRVLLCRALCATKKVLLLDEPTAGLDPIITHELYHSIQAINRDLKITVIMVSHDIQAALKYSSHILHLKNRQLFFGTREEYENSEGVQSLIGGDDL